MKPIASVKLEYFTPLDSFCLLFIGIWMSSSRWVLGGYGLTVEGEAATMSSVLFLFAITMAILFALSNVVARFRYRAQCIRYRKLNGETILTVIIKRVRKVKPIWIFTLTILLVFLILPASGLVLYIIASHYILIGANPVYHFSAKGIVVVFWVLTAFFTPLFGLYDGQFYE